MMTPESEKLFFAIYIIVLCTSCIGSSLCIAGHSECSTLNGDESTTSNEEENNSTDCSHILIKVGTYITMATSITSLVMLCCFWPGKKVCSCCRKTRSQKDRPLTFGKKKNFEKDPETVFLCANACRTLSVSQGIIRLRVAFYFLTLLEVVLIKLSLEALILLLDVLMVLALMMKVYRKDEDSGTPELISVVI
ncbi:uncharacterized protein LOC117114138 isoform X2 [Anneissia japonica]|uniref:uncharacterized protein LOC117114138 isoform X2 n=1 Tax=Anneissia japonica TaxID=1529436 RepID=UPI00142570BE|nr:uncharacterized protein LOC117114138 isoform X2 [Anneissia japonica]